MPVVSITALPLKDERDPVWPEQCCLQCAKLVGSVDLFCVPHPNKSENKCIRCYNLNITCIPIPQDHVDTFRSIQVFFKKRDLKYAFLFRRAWIIGMNNEPTARIGRQLYLLNRNIERLINAQLAIVGSFWFSFNVMRRMADIIQRNEPPVAPIEEVFGDDVSRYDV